jgi:hypothetical protein
MLRPDLNRWSLNQESLTELCLHAPHPRTRERLPATTLQSYASPGSAHHAGMGRVLTLLKGGQGKD